MELDLDTLSAAEHAAFRLTWGMSGETRSWGDLIALGQLALSQAERSTASDVRPLEMPSSAPLLAAARLFDMAAASNESPTAHRASVAQLGALTYALNGNAPAAQALILRENLFASSSPIEAAALAVAAPGTISEARLVIGDELRLVDLLDNVVAYLRTGESPYADEVRAGLVRILIECDDPFDNVLLGHAIHVWGIVRELSLVGTLLRTGVELPLSYRDALLDRGRLTLLPPQRQAIEDAGFLKGAENAVIALPTSSGKTLLGELALVAALGSDPGVVVYLAPYVALGSQVLRQLRETLPPAVRLHGLLGGFTSEEALDATVAQNVVVATPERFDHLLRNNPTLLGLLRCVVVDEAHMVEGGERGVRLEGVVTRLRLAQENGRTAARLVLLSAVVAQAEELREWLGGNTHLIETSWRPTTKRLAVWSMTGRLEWLAADDSLRHSAEGSGTAVGHVRLPMPFPGMHPADTFTAQNPQWRLLYANVAYLADFLWHRDSQPVLCVAGTRAHTRGIALSIAERFPRLDSIGERTAEAIATIRRTYPYLSSLAGCLESGVAYHNAGLPPPVREAIERAAADGELRVVAASTTLAEGVDLPFKYTIVSDWLLTAGDRLEPMSPMLFKNIAGRSGRAGHHTSGETFLVDNPVGPSAYTNDAVRRTNQLAIIAAGDPILASAVAGMTVNPTTASLAAFESQILAAIPENPDEEDFVSSFAGATLAARQLPPSDLRRAVRRTTGWMLSEESGPLARAASPIRLTPKGEAFRKTGFSPRSCEVLLAAGGLLNPLLADEELLADLLVQTAGLPEQTNDRASKKLSGGRAKYPVAPEDLMDVIRAWTAGVEPLNLFLQLPYVRRSARRDRLADWQSGDAPESTWTSDFELFTEFLTGPLSSFLPWVLRATASVSEFGGFLIDTDRLAVLASKVEQGVNSRGAAALLRSGAPISRRLANRVAGMLGDDSLETLTADPALIRELREGPLSVLGPNDEEINRLLVWLTRQQFGQRRNRS